MPSIVFNEDCMAVMAQYPNGYFDLAIVDPPYGINAPAMQMGSNPNRSRRDGHGSGPAVSTTVKLKGMNKSSFGWDNEVPSPEYFTELRRVSKNQIIWGGNYLPLPPTRCIICWDKLQPWDAFSQWEMAWTSFDKPAAMCKLSNTGGANAETKIHPTQKPIFLYRWLLSKFAEPGMKILDTHLGSGSSRIAAYREGYYFVGCEIDEGYFTAQQYRFVIETQQQSLF